MCSRISSNALTSDDPDEAAENLQPEGNRITECQVNFERHLMLALSELFKAVEVDQDMAKNHRYLFLSPFYPLKVIYLYFDPIYSFLITS